MHRTAAREFDRNFIMNFWEGTFFLGGAALFSLQVILPSWLAQLGASATMIGLLPLVWFGGVALPQLFAAEYVKPFPYRKPFIMWGALGQRLPWLVLAVSVWGFGEHPSWLVGITLALVGVFTVSTGVINPVWVELIGKITPVDQRGRFHGYRLLGGGALGLGMAWAAKWVIAHVAFPWSYAWLFGIGFAMAAISYGFFAMLTEDAPSPVGPREPPLTVLRQAAGVRTADPRFGGFLIMAPWCVAGVWMSAPFIVSFGLARGMIGPQDVAMMALVYTGAQMGWSVWFGRLGDQRGSRTLPAWSAWAAVASAGLALAAPWWPGWLWVSLVGASAANSAAGIAFNNLPLELSPSGSEGRYVAITSVTTAVASALAPFLGGVMVDSLGYPAMFAATALVSGTAIALIRGWRIMDREHAARAAAPLRAG